MSGFSASIERVVKRPFVCGCGRSHRSDLQIVRIEDKLISKIPKILERFQKKIVMIIYDPAYKESAMKICESMINGNYSVRPVLLDVKRSDETVMGQLMLSTPNDTGLLFGVGGEKVSDIVKYLSKRMKIPCALFCCTAACDSYAMPYSKITVGGYKRYLSSAMPTALFSDTDILKNMPLIELRGAVAAVFSKYSALFDWKVSSIVTGSFFCEDTYDWLQQSLRTVTQEISAEGMNGMGEKIMDCMFRFGTACDLTDLTAPALGSEHAIADMLEFLASRKRIRLLIPYPDVLGLCTYKSLAFVKNALLKASMGDAENLLTGFSFEKHRQELERVFGLRANSILSSSEGGGLYSRPEHLRRLNEIMKKRTELIRVLNEEIVSISDMTRAFEKTGGIMQFSRLGLSKESVIDAIVFSRETSESYGAIKLTFDLGVLSLSAYAFT